MADNAPTPELTPEKFAALAAHADSFRALDISHYERPHGEGLADHKSEIDHHLLNSPAPDRAALLWKLEHLLEVEDDGSISPWTGKMVVQTLADARRILGGE